MSSMHTLAHRRSSSRRKVRKNPTEKSWSTTPTWGKVVIGLYAFNVLVNLVADARTTGAL